MAADRVAGAERRRRAQGVKADQLQAAMEELDPTMARWADEFVFGEVWASDALGERERMFVAIAMLAATSRYNQLKNYLHGALQNGITEAELRELMKMLTVYVGFPSAIEGLLRVEDAVAVHRRSS